jgi:sortase (surface protein transpeptidase)
VRYPPRYTIPTLSRLNKILFVVGGMLVLASFAGVGWEVASRISYRPVSLPYARVGLIPVRLEIPSLSINVRLDASQVTNGVWSISPTNANYLIQSASIGRSGNIILYGHNVQTILGPIRGIAVGADIRLYDQYGGVHAYRTLKTDTVDPKNLAYIQPEPKETLTIFTCDGLLDTSRFIVRASPAPQPSAD